MNQYPARARADKAVDALLDGRTSKLSERLAKLGVKSYQMGIYEFKEKYRGKIV